MRTKLILLTVLFLSFTSTPSSDSAEMERIDVYGTTYDFSYSWFLLELEYSLQDFERDYRMNKETALLRACDELRKKRPNGCNNKPQSISQPRTNGCTAAPDGFFTPACNQHDICYDNLSKSRSACDSDFLDDMRFICESEVTGNWAQRRCRSRANKQGQVLHFATALLTVE